MYRVDLTPLEHSALLTVLIDRSLSKDGALEWISIPEETVVTIQDLLTRVAGAEVVEIGDPF